MRPGDRGSRDERHDTHSEGFGTAGHGTLVRRIIVISLTAAVTQCWPWPFLISSQSPQSAAPCICCSQLRVSAPTQLLVTSTTKMTNLFSTSGLIKTAECFAVFTCLVIHRIGNRGSQVSQLAVILRLLRGVAWEYYEYCQYVIDNLLCRYLLWYCLGMVRDNRFRDGLQGNTVRGELIMLNSVSKSAPCISPLSLAGGRRDHRVREPHLHVHRQPHHPLQLPHRGPRGRPGQTQPYT